MIPGPRTLYRKGRDKWLFQLRDSEPGTVTLGMRRVFIVPTRPGIAFAVLLLVMLVGALNYSLGLGFALTFFSGACAVADMYLTAKNLAMLELAPGRAPAVFAGEEAQFELHLHNRTRRDRYAVWLGFQADGEPRQAIDIPAGAARAAGDALSARPVPRLELLEPGREGAGVSGAGDAGAAATLQRRGQRGRPRHRGAG